MSIHIDTTFDFRSDANGGDPDSQSATLRKYHKLLWSKLLPSGELLSLSDTVSGIYLHHKSPLGEFNLTSDSITHSYGNWKRTAHIISQIPWEEVEDFRTTGSTIGATIIFPGNRLKGTQTLNGARGCNRKISDRFDLTLECIRRFYLGIDSPLTKTINAYGDFFTLFRNFKGYVDFFLLQGLVSQDYSNIKFLHPFDDFNSSPIPETVEEYRNYKIKSCDFVKNRNSQIAKPLASNSTLFD